MSLIIILTLIVSIITLVVLIRVIKVQNKIVAYANCKEEAETAMKYDNSIIVCVWNENLDYSYSTECGKTFQDRNSNYCPHCGGVVVRRGGK